MVEGNGSAMELAAAKRKEALILVLCNYLSISPVSIFNTVHFFAELTRFDR
jgi:hypothetical protein